MGKTTLFIIVSLALSIFIEPTLGSMFDFWRGYKVRCEELDKGSCAFSVSSTGKRCVLESRLDWLGANGQSVCGTSEITADLTNHIETNECIRACGVDRKALGISSDSLLDISFGASLCSDTCFHNCPNIIDLYYNLAAEEGLKMCGMGESGLSRGLMETLMGMSSDDDTAPSPTYFEAPAPIPSNGFF